MWGPFMVDHPSAERWASESLAVLRELVADPGSGVSMVSGVEAAREHTEPHPWLHKTGDLRICAGWELPAGYVTGWRYTTPVIDMPVYSSYLLDKLRDAGVEVRRASVQSLHELLGTAAVVVNCSGGGARRLADDPGVTPVRGHLVVVENPGIDYFFAELGETPELTYFIPHGDRVVLGSTLEQPYMSPRSRAEVIERMRRRCAAIEPRLARARVVALREGIRPVRDRIRVETAMLDGRPVIHNYGHGGGGVTVSWGCAHEVASMVEAQLDRSTYPGVACRSAEGSIG
jgi:D-amino-acid oxidase